MAPFCQEFSLLRDRLAYHPLFREPLSQLKYRMWAWNPGEDPEHAPVEPAAFWRPLPGTPPAYR